MADGAVRNLSPDNDVHKRDDTKEPGNPTESSPAIEGSVSQTLSNAPLTQVDSDWNQRQASEEQHWKDQEDNDSDIWIADVAAKLLRQYKKPRDTSRCDQGNPDQA